MGSVQTPLTNFRIPAEIKAAAVAKAESEGKTLSRVVIDFLRDYGRDAEVWDYVGADMAGDPDSASLRLWGSIPKEQAKFRRRKAGPWEPVK